MDNSLATELIKELKALTKRLFALLVIVTVFAFVSNFVWIYAWFRPADEKAVIKESIEKMRLMG